MDSILNQEKENKNSEIDSKKNAAWVKWFLGLALFCLVCIGGFVAFVDPYFHYHAPISFIRYTLDNERYQNDGIVKHFTYDAILTGSSMTENFKASQLNELFGVNSIKVPFAGGSLKEVGDNLAVALASGNQVTMVVRAMDYDRLFNDKDHVDYTTYPSYLYDANPFNDTNYLLNMDVLFVAIQDVLGFDADGKIDDDFDSYANWMPYYNFGKAALDAYYKRDQVVRCEMKTEVTAEEYVTIDENFDQNVIALAKQYPEVQFYYYFTPFCIYYFDNWYLTGELERQFIAEKYIIEKLLPYENIHLFSFNTQYDVICNLDNYRDVAHHREEVNEMILQWMKDGVGELTKENYEDYIREEWDFYMNYDYEALFAE